MRTGASLFHTRTVHHSTIALSAHQSGTPIEVGSNLVTERSEWLMNGFDSSQSAYVSVTRRVDANPLKAVDPIVNQMIADCAAAEATAPTSMRHSPQASTITASGIPNCGFSVRRPNAAHAR